LTAATRITDVKLALGRRLAYVGLFLTPGILAAVVAVRDWPIFLVAILWTATAAGYPVVRRKLPWPTGVWPTGDQVMFGALLIAATVLTMAGHAAARPVALDLWGNPEVVRVESVDRFDGRRKKKPVSTFCYTVARPGGQLMPGEICRESDEFQVGSSITVLVDPAGLVAPETPDRASGTRLTRPRGFALGLIIFIVLLGGITGGDAWRRPKPPEPAARRGRIASLGPTPRRRRESSRRR
jgi:hypothetical protein